MDFIQAVQSMKDGKKVRRKYWNDKNDICRIYLEGCKSERIIQRYNLKEKRWETYMSNLINIEATDWEIVEEKKTFEEQFPSLKERSVKYKDMNFKFIDLMIPSDDEERSNKFFNSIWVWNKDIKKHCLDKKKVKEELRTAKEDIAKGMTPLMILTTMERELELE